MLLLETRRVTKTSSLPELGQKLYGTTGKTIVNIALAASQCSFCCGFLYFIIDNLHQVTLDFFNVEINNNWFCLLCFIIFSTLCLVRKIEIFASTHIFADLMILITLITVISYGSIEIGNHGAQLSNMPFINPDTFSDAIGFSVFAFEGIGVIMPVQDITANKEIYHKLVMLVIFVVCALYLFFGTFSVLAWGNDLTTPLITD